MRLAVSCLLCLAPCCCALAFRPAGPILRRRPHVSSLAASSAAVASSSSDNEKSQQLTSAEQPKARHQRQELIRQEGGPLAFSTKYGALNPFAIYYGLVAILLGLPWYLAICLCQLFYLITFNKIDRQRRLPVFFSHVWGTLLLTLTNCWPKYDNIETLRKFYKEKRPAMFVANHNSWMDIPFLGASVGWRNYKIIAKQELRKVPILGKAIKVAGHVMVNRTDRRSQLTTLKTGMQYLTDGVHLCTFPEGTRSRSNRLQKFKNGAFKMAYKTGSPIIPISIVGAAKVHPSHWMFPLRPAHNVARVVIHEPVESEGKTETELVEAVRQSMISGLPLEQRPDDE